MVKNEEWIFVKFEASDSNSEQREFPAVGDFVCDKEKGNRIGVILNVFTAGITYASTVYFKLDDGVARYALPGYFDKDTGEFVTLCTKPAYYCRRCTSRDDSQCYFSGGKHIVYAYHR